MIRDQKTIVPRLGTSVVHGTPCDPGVGCVMLTPGDLLMVGIGLRIVKVRARVDVIVMVAASSILNCQTYTKPFPGREIVL